MGLPAGFRRCSPAPYAGPHDVATFAGHGAVLEDPGTRASLIRQGDHNLRTNRVTIGPYTNIPSCTATRFICSTIASTVGGS